jgi:hypothetical protein
VTKSGVEFTLPGKALAMDDSLELTSLLIRNSTSFQASAWCLVAEMMPEAYGSVSRCHPWPAGSDGKLQVEFVPDRLMWVV